MLTAKKRGGLKVFLLAGIFIIGVSFIISGCSSAAPAVRNSTASKPQLIVNPDSISLGVAKLMGTEIVFEGSGFNPGDDIFITLIGEADVGVPIAFAKVGSNGTFTATVESIAKITGILRATIKNEYGKDGKQKVILVLTQPTIPAGIYTAKVTSMLSTISAETKLLVRDPSFGDSFKDTLGRMLGKIDDQRS